MGLHSGIIQCKSWKNSFNFHLLNSKISNKSHVTGVTVKEGSRDQETCLFVTPIPWSRKGHPLQYSCLESPMDRGAWGATVPGPAKSWARLSD